MNIAGMPEIPDETKKKMMDFLEKVAKTFSESELKKSLPLIKSELDVLGFMSLAEITMFLLDFLFSQGKKEEQPGIKVQVEIMKDYLRLLELQGTDIQNIHLKGPAKKLLKLCESSCQTEEFISEWEEILRNLENIVSNKDFTNEEEGTNYVSEIIDYLSQFDPKKRVN